MKKVFAVLLTLVLAFIAFGCKSSGKAKLDQDPSPPSSEAGLDKNPNIPSFMSNPPMDPDYIFGIGGNKLSNVNMARQAATASARTEIATKVKTEVQNMVIQYSRSAGTENSQASLDFFESISRQMTDQTLKGVEEVKWETTPDGMLWVLMRMSKVSAASSAADAVKDVYENEAARYAEFKAMDALKMMDEQLKNKN